MWNVSGLCRYNRFVLRSSQISSFYVAASFRNFLTVKCKIEKSEGKIINNISALCTNNKLKKFNKVTE